MLKEMLQYTISQMNQSQEGWGLLKIIYKLDGALSFLLWDERNLHLYLLHLNLVCMMDQLEELNKINNENTYIKFSLSTNNSCYRLTMANLTSAY